MDGLKSWVAMDMETEWICVDRSPSAFGRVILLNQMRREWFDGWANKLRMVWRRLLGRKLVISGSGPGEPWCVLVSEWRRGVLYVMAEYRDWGREG